MLKILTLKGHTQYLINIVAEDEGLLLECIDKAIMLKTTDRSLLEDFATKIKTCTHDVLYLADEVKTVNKKYKSDIMLINKYIKNVDIEVYERYTGDMHVLTDFGIFEVNSIDTSLEHRLVRINVAGEYNDIKLVPAKGTSYATLISYMENVQGSAFLDFKTQDGIITDGKVKFRLEHI